MTQANGQLHLLYAEWWDTESAYTETTLFLYHHETGETESLPNWTEGSFSPDGEQLLLVRPIFPTAPAFDFGLRPVEPRSADILPLAIPSEAVAYWQPDSQHIVVSETDRLSLYHLPDVLLLNTWITDTTMGLPYFHDLQSPDGRRLLARGYYSNPEDMPLYVITVPSS